MSKECGEVSSELCELHVGEGLCKCEEGCALFANEGCTLCPEYGCPKYPAVKLEGEITNG